MPMKKGSVDQGRCQFKRTRYTCINITCLALILQYGVVFVQLFISLSLQVSGNVDLDTELDIILVSSGESDAEEELALDIELSAEVKLEGNRVEMECDLDEDVLHYTEYILLYSEFIFL